MKAIRGALPARRSSSTGTADEIEIAKPMLFADPGSAIAVLMPMTRPRTSTSGPPEFPGLIAASVWIASMSVSVALMCTVRPRPETMPEVTVGLPAIPSALPIATTASPTCSVSESPSGTVGRPVRSILTTARSWVRSSPTTRPRTDVAVAQRHDELGGGVRRLRVRDVRVRDDDTVRRDDEAGTGTRTGC